MKTAHLLTVVSVLLTGTVANAQTPPPNHWKIDEVDTSKLPPASDQTGVTFDKDISPLFKASCVRCHGAQRPRAGLRLDSLNGALKGGRDGKVIIPGDSKNSLLVAAAARIDDNIAMPPKRRGRGGPGPAAPPPGGGNNAQKPPGDAGGGASGPPPNPGPGPGGPPNGPRPNMPKPLTAEEVGLVRAWIDQGAK